MNFDIFAPDFGTLPSAYLERSAVTNPTELFWSNELLALLRLCGAKEEMIGERASDYDRFLSVFRALPLLEEHPTRAWIASVLDKHFHLTELPTEATAPSVWRTLCESLMQHPIAPKDLVCGSWLCDGLTVPNCIPEQITPVLDAGLLLQTNVRSAAAWSAEIASTVAHFADRGCQKILFCIGKDFDFVSPSRYHVDRALSLTKKDRNAANLLICQLMREICIAAQEHDLMLVLDCAGDPSALAHLLKYVEENVQLPRLCWSVRRVCDTAPLLAFCAKPHKNEILAALSYESVMTEDELSAALASWKVRYPIARLCYLTARDLRQTPHAQAHILDMLKKSKTKI